MCISAILTAVGVGVSAAGAITSYQASKKQAELQEQQMELEADRHRRSAYRDMIRAQAQSEVAGASAGALEGSGVMGGVAQAANSGMQTQRDINQNETLAQGMFSAQKQAAMGGTMTSLGQGIGSLSNAFVKNQDAIRRLGKTAQTKEGNIWGSWFK